MRPSMRTLILAQGLARQCLVAVVGKHRRAEAHSCQLYSINQSLWQVEGVDLRTAIQLYNIGIKDRHITHTTRVRQKMVPLQRIEHIVATVDQVVVGVNPHRAVQGQDSFDKLQEVQAIVQSHPDRSSKEVVADGTVIISVRVGLEVAVVDIYALVPSVLAGTQGETQMLAVIGLLVEDPT